MMIFLKKRATIFLSLIISLNICAQTPAPTIPEFSFFKLDNSAFTNKNLAINKLVFFCFFDISCDHCQRAIGKISQHYAEFSKTAVYLVTLDSKENIAKFMNQYGKNLPGQKNITILRDAQSEFVRKFKPKKYPSMFLYSRDRKLILYDDREENVIEFLKQIKLNSK